jgi:hypothetical protein
MHGRLTIQSHSHEIQRQNHNAGKKNNCGIHSIPGAQEWRRFILVVFGRVHATSKSASKNATDFADFTDFHLRQSVKSVVVLQLF